ARDVSAAVLGQRERHVEEEAALGVLSGGDAVEHLDRAAALEKVVEHHQSYQEIASEPVDLLDGEHLPVAHEVDRRLESWSVVGSQPAATPLLENAHADRVEGIVLPLRLLIPGAHPYESPQGHEASSRSFSPFNCCRLVLKQLNG